MIGIPNDPLAIELGIMRENAMESAQAWTSEVIRLGNLIWDYCEVRNWPRLELTFGGSIKIASDDCEGEGDECYVHGDACMAGEK